MMLRCKSSKLASNLLTQTVGDASAVAPARHSYPLYNDTRSPLKNPDIYATTDHGFPLSFAYSFLLHHPSYAAKNGFHCHGSISTSFYQRQSRKSYSTNVSNAASRTVGGSPETTRDSHLPSRPPNTLYDALELERTADRNQIKQAYLRLVKVYHPDVPGGSAERFKAVHDAYLTLADETKRQVYDWKTFGVWVPKNIVASDSAYQNQRRQFWRERQFASSKVLDEEENDDIQFRKAMEESIRRAQQLRWQARKDRAAEVMRTFAARFINSTFWWVPCNQRLEKAVTTKISNILDSLFDTNPPSLKKKSHEDSGNATRGDKANKNAAPTKLRKSVEESVSTDSKLFMGYTV